MDAPPPPNNLPYSIHLVLCMSSEGRDVTAFCQRIKFQDGLNGRSVKNVLVVSFWIFTAVFVQMKAVFGMSALDSCLI